MSSISKISQNYEVLLSNFAVFVLSNQNSVDAVRSYIKILSKVLGIINVINRLG